MSTELALMDKKQLSRLDDSLFSKDLAPHYMQLATKLSSSALVPKSFQGKPQDLFIAWEMGYQVGLSPAQAMQCIAVINGKPAMWGDEMLALCMVHPDFDDISEVPTFSNDGGTIIGYVCTVKRKGRTPTINPFTLDMAKKAGLLGKQGPWTTATERMLKLRARGYSLRDAFPDALKGIKSREEIEDYVDAEYKIIEGSRTEFLKNEILIKENNVETNVEAINLDSRETFIVSELEANQSSNDSTMDQNRKEEKVSSTNDSPVLAIQPEQAELIFALIDATGFSEDRLKKALEYYEVDTVGKLNSESAEHFIAQLNKL